MDFNELQKSWREQQLNVPEQSPAAKEQLLGRWRRQQRTVLLSNIGVTAGFAVALGTVAWVFLSWHRSHGWLFSGSLLCMSLLLLVYLWVIWRGAVFHRPDFSLPVSTYASRYVAALRWRRKTITTFVRLYMLLLWLSLMFYFISVLEGTSMVMRIAAPVATTAYMFIIIYAVRKKKRRQLAEIDSLIADFSALADTEEFSSRV